LTYKNKADALAYKHKWLSKNPEKRRQYEKDWRQKNPEMYAAQKKRNFLRHKKKKTDQGTNLYLKRRYGITLEERTKRIEEQGGCATCGVLDPGSRGWHVDHCHKTGKVRGILCAQCNIALGNVKDSPETLRRLAAYIEACHEV
jgi:hypothetical protein